MRAFLTRIKTKEELKSSKKSSEITLPRLENVKRSRNRLRCTPRQFLLKCRPWLWYLIPFCLFLVILLSLDQYLRIARVTVTGARPYPFHGQNYFIGTRSWLLDTATIQQYIQNTNPGYAIDEVRKEYPGTVHIKIHPYLPVSYLTVSEGVYLLSPEGRVVKKVRDVPDNRYPVMSYYQEIPYNQYQTGDIIGMKEITDGLFFLQAVQATKEKVNSIDIAGFHMLGLYTDTHTYLFTSERDKERQKYLFEQAVLRFGIEGTSFSTLDVRFEKPIVQF